MKDQSMKDQRDCNYNHEQSDSLGPDERDILWRYKLYLLLLSEDCNSQHQELYHDCAQASYDNMSLAHCAISFGMKNSWSKIESICTASIDGHFPCLQRANPGFLMPSRSHLHFKLIKKAANASASSSVN